MRIFLKVTVFFTIIFLAACDEDELQPASLARIEISSSNGDKLDVLWTSDLHASPDLGSDNIGEKTEFDPQRIAHGLALVRAMLSSQFSQ